MPEGFRTCRLIPAPEGFQSWENPFMGVTLYDDKPKLCGRASNRCAECIHKNTIFGVSKGVVFFEGLRFLRPPFFEMSLFEDLLFLGVFEVCHF
jgi:hypothetical protein